MQTWFEAKVKYLKIDQGGFERKVSDSYLLDAVSFTDAETRIFKQMNEITSGEFQVTNIKKSNISEIISNEEGEWWYKAKISLVTIDEEAGKEKKVTNYILVMADSTEQALKHLEEGLSYMLIPYVVTGINISSISEVFPYDLEENAARIFPYKSKAQILIANERKEQIEKHGYTLEHDNKYTNGELIEGYNYCMSSYNYSVGSDEHWPEAWSNEVRFKIDAKSPLDKLVVAGAFIQAEIDRTEETDKLKDAMNAVCILINAELDKIK